MDDDRLLCVGSYTAASGGRGTGVTTLRWSATRGDLVPISGCVLPSPSYLCWHPFRRVLYATNELEHGTVSALRLDRRGRLSILKVLPSGGAAPCHLSITPDARYLLCSNYGGGLAVFALGEDGDLTAASVLTQRPSPRTSRVHMAVPSVHDGLVHAADLGMDEIRTYRRSGAGLAIVDRCRLPDGSGPRHLAESADGRHLYVVGELDSTVRVLARRPTLAVLATRAATAEPTTGLNYPAHVCLSDDARHLYVSNRGADRITVFDVAADGMLGPARDAGSGGSWPRHHALVDDQLFVAAERSDELVGFDVDARTGELSLPQRRYPVRSPACVAVSRPLRRLQGS